MSYCEDYPCCGHESGCCPDFDENGKQLNMVCTCGAKLHVNAQYSICNSCMKSDEDLEFGSSGFYNMNDDDEECDVCWKGKCDCGTEDDETEDCNCDEDEEFDYFPKEPKEPEENQKENVIHNFNSCKS